MAAQQPCFIAFLDEMALAASDFGPGSGSVRFFIFVPLVANWAGYQDAGWNWETSIRGGMRMGWDLGLWFCFDCG